MKIIFVLHGDILAISNALVHPAWEHRIPISRHFVCPRCGEEWGAISPVEGPARHRFLDFACENCWDSPEIVEWGGVEAQPPTFFSWGPTLELDHLIVKWPREVLARDFLYLCELQ